MPQAIPFIVSAGATAAGVSAIGVFVLSTAASFAVADYQKKKAERQAREAFNRSLQDRIVTLRSAVAPRQYVLGTVRCGGTLMYAETVGTNRTSLDSVTAICANQTTITGYYIGDEYVAVADFPGEKYGRSEIVEYNETVVATRQPGGNYVATLGFVPNGGTVNAFWRFVTRGRTRATVVSVVGTTLTLLGSSAPGSASTYDVEVHYSAAVGEKLQVQFKNGHPDQTTDDWPAVLTPDWTSDHRLRGVTYIRTLMVWDENIYANGAPSISGVFTGGSVDGHPFYDPRDASNPASTSNPALLAAWWMTLPFHLGGCGIPSSWINWTTVGAAANICDELITVRTLDGSGYEQIRRYQCNTVLSTANDPISNLEIILSSMAGRRVFTAGQYRIFAGAFRSATITITDAHIAGKHPITVNATQSNEIPPNVVTATFADATKNWAETSPKPVKNQTYITNDSREKPVPMSLQATTDPRLANYLMGVHLETSRPAFSVTLSVTGIGEDIALGDTAQLIITNRPSYAGKTFEVVRIVDRWDGTFEITLSEIRTQTWALDPDTFTPTNPVPIEDLSHLWNVQPMTGLEVDLADPQTMPDGNSVTQATLTWDPITQEGFGPAGRIEVRYQEVGGQWISAGSLPADSTGTVITASLFDGTFYQFQVRPVNALGAAGRWIGEWVEIAGTPLAEGVQGPGLFTWANPVNVATTSSSIEKNAGAAAWDAGAHSLQSYSVGCFVTARAGELGTAKIIGLNDDPAVDASNAGINHAWLTTATDVAQIYESGIMMSAHGAVTLDAEFSVTYDSANVRYFKAGTVMRTTPATGLRLFADTSIFTAGGSWINVAFGPQGGVGGQGPAGAPAQSIRLSATAYAFTYDSAGAVSPAGQSIAFTASRQNIATATVWSTVPSGIALTGSGDSRTLSAAAFGANTSVQVIATAAGFSDSITVVRMQQGATGPSAIVGLLTNEAHNIAADPDGVVGNPNSANGQFLVYEGITDRTSVATFSVVSVSGCTATINTATNTPIASQPRGYYRLDSISADNATVTLRAVYNSVTIDKVFSVTKSRQGVPGDGANLLRIDEWTIASPLSANLPHWTRIQDAAGENAIVLGGAGTAPIGPLGITEPLWECRPSGNFNADGGWEYPNIPIDPAKTYRSVVWVRVNQNGLGNFYHGCDYTSTFDLGGGANANPYFLATGVGALEVNQWYLSVGLIHGSGYGGGYTGVAGLYDPRTGKRVLQGVEFRMAPSAMVQMHRVYHFYNSGSTTRQWLARPRFEEVNGNEPSIYDLMGIRLPTPWIERGLAVASLNSFHKLGGTNSWPEADVISITSYTSCHLQFKAGQTNTHKMCGLNTDPYADMSYASIDFAWYPYAGGTQIYENGVFIGEYGPYTLGTEFAITYDGVAVRYYKDRVLRRDVNLAGARFYVDSAFYEPSSSISSVRWGPGIEFETVGNGDLEFGAATEVTQSSASYGGGGFGSWPFFVVWVNYISFTPRRNHVIEITAIVDAYAVQFGGFICLGVDTGTDPSIPGPGLQFGQGYGVTSTDRKIYTLSSVFPVLAGVTYRVGVMAGTSQAPDSVGIYTSTLILEQIKS